MSAILSCLAGKIVKSLVWHADVMLFFFNYPVFNIKIWKSISGVLCGDFFFFCEKFLTLCVVSARRGLDSAFFFLKIVMGNSIGIASA